MLSPDALLHYNTYQGKAVDFYEQIWAATESGEGGIPRGRHVVTNALFEVRGDVGYGECYLEGRRAGVGTTRAGAESQATGPGFPMSGSAGSSTASSGAPASGASRAAGWRWSGCRRRWTSRRSGRAGTSSANFAPTRYDGSDPSYERNWG